MFLNSTCPLNDLPNLRNSDLPDPQSFNGSGSLLIADLVWAINSPLLALVDSEPVAGVNPSLSDQLKVDPERVDVDRLSDFFRERPPRKVGHYFERLVHFWLAHVRGVEMVAANQQIFRGNRTLGEIDFVFRDEAGRLNHWEVAVKYYLYQHEQTVLGSHFIGPNLRDTFELKMERIKQHQLPMSAEPFPNVEIRQAMVKGFVFYESSRQRPSTLPNHMMANHLRGSILRSQDLNMIGDDAESRYFVLNKPYWLSAAGVAAHSRNSLSTGDEIADQIGQRESLFGSPVLLAQFRYDGDQYQEVDRIFVVDDQWPS